MTMKTVTLDPSAINPMGLLTAKISGTTSLIQNRFSKRKVGVVCGGMKGEAKKARPPKNPEADFLDAIHWIGPEPKDIEEFRRKNSWRYGIPAVAFKGAMIRMGKQSGMKMVDSRVLFFVRDGNNGLVEIKAKKPFMREDRVRVQKSMDVRHRPEFQDWSATVVIEYNARNITGQQLAALLIEAGKCNGIGDWRPGGTDSTGTHGCWGVVSCKVSEPDFTKIDGGA